MVDIKNEFFRLTKYANMAQWKVGLTFVVTGPEVNGFTTVAGTFFFLFILRDFSTSLS